MSNLETYLEYFARKGLLDEGEERIIGDNSSSCWEIKVAFDGFGNDGRDINLESYAMYIHKNAASEDFAEFPGHDSLGPAVIHRPDEEACVLFWYNVAEDSIELLDYEDSIQETRLSLEEAEQILQSLHDKYVEEDSGNIDSSSSAAWPFG